MIFGNLKMTDPTRFGCTIRAAVCLFFTAQIASGDAVDFERDVLPTLEVSCFKCHSERVERPKAGLRLDSKSGILEAVEELQLFEPGKGEASLMVELMSLPKGDDDAMPPAGKAPTVSPPALAAVKRWIDEGARFGDWERHVHPVVERGVSGLAEAAESLPDDPQLAAAEIDRLVRRARPEAYDGPVVDDATFLRRTALLVLGRVLSHEESSRWLDGDEPLDRAAVVAHMLESPGDVSRQFNYWADVLRAKSRQYANPKSVWLNYIKRSLAENVAYDRWVHKMLTASGFSIEYPAIGLHGKDSKNRLAGFEAAISVFLGTEIGCAQCHDHPYEPISRRDYFEMYGYFAQTHGGVGQSKRFFKNIGRDGGNAVQGRLARERKGKGIYSEEADRYVAAHHIFGHDQAMGSCSFNYNGGFGIRLPRDYQYDDGKPGQNIKPVTLFGIVPPLEIKGFEGEKPMDAFAKWTTSPDNLKFTHVVANRMWAQVFGYSLLGATTDIEPPGESAHPELTAYLAALMVRLDYDLRAFRQTLFSTDLYARQAAVRDGLTPQTLTPPAVRRLSAEQIWDSIVTLAVADPDAGVLDFAEPDWSYQIAARNVKTQDELYALIAEHAKTLGDRQADAKRRRDRGRKLQQQGFLPEDLRRPSQLPQPAQAGHFLSLFGQAARETIEDQWANPTTPQALTLLNGPLFEEIVREGSPLHAAWAGASTSRAKTEAVYRAMLGRALSERELELIAGRTDIETEAGLADLAWSLMNTPEFLFLF